MALQLELVFDSYTSRKSTMNASTLCLLSPDVCINLSLRAYFARHNEDINGAIEFEYGVTQGMFTGI